MIERLLRHPHVKEIDPEKYQALEADVVALRTAGHAVAFEETVVDGRITSMTAHHYRTCEACKTSKNKG